VISNSAVEIAIAISNSLVVPFKLPSWSWPSFYTLVHFSQTGSQTDGFVERRESGEAMMMMRICCCCKNIFAKICKIKESVNGNLDQCKPDRVTMTNQLREKNKGNPIH